MPQFDVETVPFQHPCNADSVLPRDRYFSAGICRIANDQRNLLCLRRTAKSG